MTADNIMQHKWFLLRFLFGQTLPGAGRKALSPAQMDLKAKSPGYPRQAWAERAGMALRARCSRYWISSMLSMSQPRAALRMISAST